MVKWYEGLTFQDEHGIINNHQNIDYKDAATAKSLLFTLCSDGAKIQHKKDDLSELDIYNMIDLWQTDAHFLIKNFFKRSWRHTHFTNIHTKNTPEAELITPEGIDYLNKILNEAILFYKRTLKRDIEDSFFADRKKWEDGLFTNTSDVINFLRANTTKQSHAGNRQIICSLMKIAHCINIKNQREKESERAEEIFDEISELHIYPHFLNKKNNEIDSDKMKGKCKRWEKWTYKEFATKEYDQIRFRWSARIKDDDMIILKMLSNPEYNDISAIKDIYWKRNECNSKEDALLLIQYHWINIYKKDPKTELKVKNLFEKTPEKTEIFIEKMKDNLDPEFLTFLENASHKRDDGKNSEYYEDAKLIWPLTDKQWKKHSVEIQFNLLNNRNEEHFSHHRIYKMKAIIEAIVRLQWSIRRTHIEKLIHIMLQEHKTITQKEEPGKFPELFYLGGNIDPENSEIAEKAIYEHFVQEWVILELKLPNTNKRRICTSKNSRNRFHQKEEYELMYPENAEILRKWERHTDYIN